MVPNPKLSSERKMRGGGGGGGENRERKARKAERTKGEREDIALEIGEGVIKRDSDRDDCDG